MAYSLLEVPFSYPSTDLLVPSVPLADKNWFHTGGTAQYFAEPRSAEEFQLILDAAGPMPLYVMGEGANMLISDEGFEGLILRPQLKAITRIACDSTHDLVEAQAGVRFGDLITWCLAHNLSGLEEFSGIPGTVGGSVYINIHYYEYLLSQFLVSAQVIEKKTGVLKHVDASWFKFGYNYSTLHEGTHYLVSACFKLRKIDAATTMYAQGRREEMIRHRMKRYPSTYTCGSFFRNFTPKEVVDTKNQLIYVAYYLDQLGLKGELSVGDARVSHQHANMIVHTGKATTQDIITLARTMQELVYNRFGIIPQPECRLVGFKEHPLLS
jgi:UDP-N-acetylmuramate dehydrogenase